MLARRELSEAQVRQRLGRRGHDPSDIDDAIARLRDERALDDARVAAAIARTETSIKRRGRLRVRLQIERAGIARDVAQRAVNDVFTDVDDDALIHASLSRRLRHGATIDSDRTFERLYRYLIGQGFDSDRVVALLRKRRRADSESR